MYTNPIRKSEWYVPVTEEEIGEIANSLQLEIPDYLVEFFVQYNGACLTNCVMPDFCTVTTVTIFSNGDLGERSYLSILNYYEINRESLRYPDYLLPFALNLNGSCLFVSLGLDDAGYVYKSYWEDDEVELIHTNFVDFINSLEPWDPSPPVLPLS